MKARTAGGEAFFALASAPDPGATAELLVKRGGKIADALVAARDARATLELTRPFGEGLPGRGGGGAGRAALRGRLRRSRRSARSCSTSSRHRNRFGRVTLFYGQRHGAEFAYRGEHLDWERRGMRVVLCPSGRRRRLAGAARARAAGGALARVRRRAARRARSRSSPG